MANLKHDKRVTVRLSEDMYKALARDANAHDRSVAQSCRALIRDGLIDAFFDSPVSDNTYWEVVWFDDNAVGGKANFMDMEEARGFYKQLKVDKPDWETQLYTVTTQPGRVKVHNG